MHSIQSLLSAVGSPVPAHYGKSFACLEIHSANLSKNRSPKAITCLPLQSCCVCRFFPKASSSCTSCIWCRGSCPAPSTGLVHQRLRWHCQTLARASHSWVATLSPASHSGSRCLSPQPVVLGLDQKIEKFLPSC